MNVIVVLHCVVFKVLEEYCNATQMKRIHNYDGNYFFSGKMAVFRESVLPIYYSLEIIFRIKLLIL